MTAPHGQTRSCTTMAASSLSLLFLLAVLVASAAVPGATAGGEYSGARMVIIRGPGTTSVGGPAGGGARTNKWRQHYRRLEDEVAPEFGGGLLGAGEGDVGYRALDKDRPACTSSCAGKRPGQPYTRDCTYESRCPHTPAGVAN